MPNVGIVIDNVLIVNNLGHTSTGTIHCQNNSNLIITNSTLVGNNSDGFMITETGSISLGYSSTANINNSIFETINHQL